MAFTRPLVYSFWSFQASGIILQQINVKDDPSRMRCKDLNSRLRLLPWPLNQGTCLQSKLFLHFFCSSSRILRIWCLKIFKWNKKWQISKYDKLSKKCFVIFKLWTNLKLTWCMEDTLSDLGRLHMRWSGIVHLYMHL